MFGSDLIEDRVINPKQKGPAIVPFITAGYPNKDDFLSLVKALANCADVIEIGVPFSDPMADGVTIQRSSHAAIESGVRLQWILKQLKTISIDTPIILMSYLNPLFVYGYAELAQDSKDAGVDDLSFITMNMERGIIATLALGRTPHPHPNGYGGDQTIRIMGTHGMLYIDANRPSWMSVGKSGSSNKKYHHDNIYHMVDHYVNSLLNGTDHMGTEKDARDTLEITLAALESAQNNRLVTL